MVTRKPKTTTGAPKKAPKQLDYECELFRHIREGDRNPKLVVLNDDGKVEGKPSKMQIREFVDFGTIDGRHDLAIGIGYQDRRGKTSKMAISIARKEAKAFLRFL